MSFGQIKKWLVFVRLACTLSYPQEMFKTMTSAVAKSEILGGS